jgi:plastocyanin
MKGSALRRVVLAISASGVLAMGAGYAFGASESVTTAPACCTYSKPTFTVDAGQVASFQNATTGVTHTMTASGEGPDGKALFDSGDVSGGATGAAAGTQFLAPGTYHFFCKVHGPSMAADLIVSPNGTPVARPQVSLKVLSRKVAKVASSGKLKLQLSAATASDGISLSARKGAKKLGSAQNVSLAAGASRVVKLKLGSSARNALRNLSSVKVKVSADVPFGSPVRAKRNLH